MRLLMAAHGTDSHVGTATTAALTAAVAAARPEITVSRCFLSVASPSLAQALAARGDEPTVVVPLLLATGYHVLTDIPAVVSGRRKVRVARHLGPDPRVIDALVDRLDPTPAASTVLVGIGSSRAEARADFAVAADALSERVGSPVTVLTLSGGLRSAIRALPRPVRVATYLLAEGRFLESLRAAAAGVGVVADPIGAHPSVVSLILERYDEAIR
jgi:sirohydrochlorin ferrochelatase